MADDQSANRPDEEPSEDQPSDDAQVARLEEEFRDTTAVPPPPDVVADMAFVTSAIAHGLPSSLGFDYARIERARVEPSTRELAAEAIPTLTVSFRATNEAAVFAQAAAWLTAHPRHALLGAWFSQIQEPGTSSLATELVRAAAAGAPGETDLGETDDIEDDDKDDEPRYAAGHAPILWTIGLSVEPERL